MPQPAIQMSEVNFRYGEIRKFADDVEETRTVEFIISDESKDRHGTVLKSENWNLDNFNKNGIVGYQHNVHGGDMCNGPDPDSVIGKGYAYRENGKVIGRVTFEPAEINPLAEKIFRKVLFGSLRATSVGFLPVGEGKFGEGDEARNGSNPTYYFAGQELLEFSIVNIPSNPNAVGRSIRDQTHNALMFVKKALGEDYSFGDIERMTVGEVLKALPANNRNNIHTEEKKADPLQVELKFSEEEIREMVDKCAKDVMAEIEAEQREVIAAPVAEEITEENEPGTRESEQAEDNTWSVEAEARTRLIYLKSKTI